jgi:hypothetical protein
MPLDLAKLLHKDIRAISRGQPTNTVLPELKKIEIPNKTRNTHPKDNHIQVDLSGTEGKANVSIYTDGSKTEHHVGASVVAVENSIEIHIETQRLNNTCSLSSRTLRHNNGSRMDPTPKVKIPLLRDKRGLQNSTISHCK